MARGAAGRAKYWDLPAARIWYFYILKVIVIFICINACLSKHSSFTKFWTAVIFQVYRNESVPKII